MTKQLLGIFNANGDVRDDSIAEIHSVVAFPNDEHSRARYKEFVFSYLQRFVQHAPNSVTSKFEHDVDALVNKSIGAKAAAGLVATSLFQLSASQNEKPTIYQAARHASEKIKKLKTADFRPLKGRVHQKDQWIDVSYRLVDAPKNLELRFKEYSNIASIMAAKLALPRLTSDPINSQDAATQTLKLTQILMAFQSNLHTRYPEHFGNAWEVDGQHLRGLGPSISWNSDFNLVVE